MMGIDAPHRRGLGDKAAHCLSYDILGPMPQGEDVGMGTKVKYIMVATVAVPKLPREEDTEEEEEELPGEEGQPLPIGDEERPSDPVMEEQVQDLNAAWKNHVKDLSEPVGVQNITVVEPLGSRSQLDVTRTATRIYCRFKAIGGEHAEGPHRQRVCISVEGISVFLQEVWPLSNHDGRR